MEEKLLKMKILFDTLKLCSQLKVNRELSKVFLS